MMQVMPHPVQWLRASIAGFEPDRNQLVPNGGERIAYHVLVAAPSIEQYREGLSPHGGWPP